jgi:hypothetical protein
MRGGTDAALSPYEKGYFSVADLVARSSINP